MSVQSTGMLARLRQPIALHAGPKQLVGGTPQVSLLPAEVREAGAVAKHRRMLIAVVVVAAVVAVVAVFAAQNVASAAQMRLDTANRQSAVLVAESGRFNDLRRLEATIALGKAGIAVGSSTLIDWERQIEFIEASMPSGYTVTALSANGATPFAPYAQATDLLEPRRAATVTMTVTSPAMSHQFSVWLRKLRSIPAYADASANTLLDQSSGVTTISLVVHLTAKAISAEPWTEQP